MANADQILSLIRNHLANDDAQFRKIALQISAVEAKNGHVVLARTIQELLNKHNNNANLFKIVPQNTAIDDLLLQIDPIDNFADMIADTTIMEKLERVIKEYTRRDDLQKYGLANRRKLLLYGTPGTGKTMTAGVLAKEFNLPCFIVRMEKIITKFMGETGQKLGRVFDLISAVPAVYLFDEFDAIGVQRGMDNDVGEQRRILNTFLQLLDRDASDSFIVAATNSINSIDKAIFRRFDDVIEYKLPNAEQRISLLQEYLYSATDLDFTQVESLFEGMSHAEIKMVCSDVFKESLLNDSKIDLQLVKNVVAKRTQFCREIG